MFWKKSMTLLAIAAFLVSVLSAQSKNDFEANWKKVAAFEKQGLTKSALREVIIIYNQATKENNDPQQIKSAIYQVKYRQMIEQDSQENNVLFIDTLVAKARQPAKSILQNMQAELLWRYLQNNRYKLYNRTKIIAENQKDITTWSLEKLHTVIADLHVSSLREKSLLKNSRLENFEPVIVKGENTRHLRPTLYDFLAHRALAYFMNDERNLIKPLYQFIINQPGIFAPASQFATAPFPTKDSAALQHKAILILQELTRFHATDKSTDALLDIDLIRLEFGKQFAVIENKAALYENALKNIEKVYAGNPGVAQAMYLRSRLYHENGQQYNPLSDTTYQFELIKSRSLCEEAIKKYPGSEGAVNCQNLLTQILQPFLVLETEKVNIPGQPFRTLVQYKNLPAVYFRLVKITREDMRKMDRRNYEKFWKELVSLKSLKSWSVTLPDPKDFQEHSTEIKVDALAGGTYLLLASTRENFSLEKNIIAKQFTHVSEISYIHNNLNEYYVLNRDNGQPLPNTVVQVWETKYNYNKNENEEIKAENYITDKNGYFKLKDIKAYRSFTMQFRKDKDELFLDENNYNNTYNSYEEPKKPLAFLFTDRSIYRPGQLIYFKGIVLNKEKETGRSAVVGFFKSSVQLRDANGQKVSELALVTNEFGSYNGSFKLPEGSLTGQFSLFDSTTNTTHYFNVEEYKRPKFFVEINKPSGSYRVFDSVKVLGTAKAYAGNNIPGGTVRYRVVRKVRYQPWWYSSYGDSESRIFPPRTSDEMEITNGVTITDANGEFVITFKALPDEKIAKKDQPTFQYEITADITDLNGETRSSSTVISVAYQMVQIDIKLPAKVDVDSLKTILVTSTNLNDIDETLPVTVTAHKLKDPARIFRKRYWAQPDQFVISREAYYQLFPYDIYKDENDVKKYPLEEKIFEKSDSSNRSWNLAKANWKPGWYKLVAVAKDKTGEEVTAEKYVLVTGNQQPNRSEPVIVNVKNASAEPGDKIQYNISTGFQNVWLIHSLVRMEKGSETTHRTLKVTEPFTNLINIEEADRGGLAMNYTFVQHNRVYEGSETFTIPWKNKALTISYESFRDKTLPGSKEKLTVKISGYKGEKVAAEMLASMYDASLDQFKKHNWSPLNIWPTLYERMYWSSNGFSAIQSEQFTRSENQFITPKPKSYDRLLSFDFHELNDVVVVGYGVKNTGGRVAESKQQRLAEDAGVQAAPGNQPVYDSVGSVGNERSLAGDQPKQPTIQVRKNFNETAFFFPALKTDASGNISFSFTVPEALTEWKLLTFAHTKDLASGYTEHSLVTQKPLMVQPNAPRFFREGDRMEFSAKIVNMGEKEVTGTAHLELLDAATGKPVDGWFKNIFPNQYFTIGVGQSGAVKFPFEIPFNFNSALTYRVVAQAADYSDGEEMILPVLTNRMLVTESFPINLRNASARNFKFEKLLTSGSSNTLSHHSLTVEYTANPAWYAVQALPYLADYPYECAEQVFNRYYANALAGHITTSAPRIKAIFEKWKTTDTSALLSNLQKNEELKTILLQETPWVLDARDEAQQKKNIALLFDMVKMNTETEKSLSKLKESQSPNGGFVWFKGGPDDRFITQYIATGIGHLRKLGAGNQPGQIASLVDKAIPYLDKKIKEDYDELVKNKVDLKNNHLGYAAVQYLYMRSFFPSHEIQASAKVAVDFYRAQAKKYWLNTNKYMQAMIALALHRSNDKSTPSAILKSLKENAIHHPELGMYWKEWTIGGYYWYQAPIESQALMIEAFSDIDKSIAVVDDLKTWLLKQKQTQHWRTTKATAEACYALLLAGNNWLDENPEIHLTLGNQTFTNQEKGEAGTGYFKKTIKGGLVQPGMGDISVKISQKEPGKTASTSWGSVYWQYFEDLDKITPASTPLSIQKQLYVVKNSDSGPQLEAVKNNSTLTVGDKVTVRIVLKVDRDMEYVHMKDMRAACMEPVNVLSGYKYQGGLGYYESTLDASTNFFFNQLRRGSYVFEYNVFVTLPGDFSNGITSIESMYAPEFRSHSEGIRVKVN